MTNFCYGVGENCKNPESFGNVCVQCNQCGRFDEDKVIYVTQEEMREAAKWRAYGKILKER